jgi:uncharacterized membrane protein
MTALTILLQWLHVGGAIFWFGSVLYSDFVLIPVIQGFPLDLQRTVGSAIGARTAKVLTPLAGIVVLLGILRGLTGNVRLNRLFDNGYNITWLVSLVLAVILIVYSQRVLNPVLGRLETTQPGPALEALVSRIKALATGELAFFFVLFTLMIAMRFGY